MSNTLFSNYSQGENRVTATILAVFERISFTLVERILQQLCQETETELLEFRNQPTGPASVPDAVIRASFAYWIETKIVPDTVRKDQIIGHLQALDDYSDARKQMLLVLTPDAHKPSLLDDIDDDRLAWANFDTFVEVISTLVTKDEAWFVSDEPQPTEREQELLRELVRFLIAQELLGTGDQVLVVAAKHAINEYLSYGVYMCQPNRTFQPSSHMAFYSSGKIHHEIPAIQEQIEEITLEPAIIEQYADISDDNRRRLLQIANHLRQSETMRLQKCKVVFLTAPDDPNTLRLTADIENDLTSESGRTIAFVQGQRYIPIERFEGNPQKTSDLLD